MESERCLLLGSHMRLAITETFFSHKIKIVICSQFERIWLVTLVTGRTQAYGGTLKCTGTTGRQTASLISWFQDFDFVANIFIIVTHEDTVDLVIQLMKFSQVLTLHSTEGQITVAICEESSNRSYQFPANKWFEFPHFTLLRFLSDYGIP